MKYIVWPEETERRAELGGKAGALAELMGCGVPVPAWFVVSPLGFGASAGDAAIAACATGAVAPEGQRRVPALTLAEEVREELAAALTRLVPEAEGRVAVRSSAPEEDGSTHSFAGQLESFLAVAPADVPRRVVDVWRSALGQRVLAYRRERGLGLRLGAPAVLVQRMVHPEAAGVAFSADPVSGRRGTAVVSAVHGLAASLVGGEVDADTFRVSRDGAVEARDLVPKAVRPLPTGDRCAGVREVEVAAAPESVPVLTDAQAVAVAALARRAAGHFGRPQDIEWGLEGGTLFLLQARPITTLATRADPDGERALWDNSNIAESYGGVTTPLTFSFARRAYEEVYRQFCRLMGVPARVADQHGETFRRMLGLIRGRVYYNLLSWYRMLSILPGFRTNRRFMEQMMGVREGLPEELVAAMARDGLSTHLRDASRLALAFGRLVVNHVRLEARIAAFRRRLEDALRPPAVPLEALRIDELAAAYRELERRLLTRWDAPIVNDFFAMVFHGLLGRLVAKWFGEGAEQLHNDLLCACGDVVSAEPARLVQELGATAAGDPELVQALRQGTLPEINRLLGTRSQFARRYQHYLERFGDRCLEELKLESPTLDDDPLPLLRAVGEVAGRSGGGPRAPGSERDPRARAEARVERELRFGLRRALFRWVLDNARRRVRDRENLRFERTRLFGRVRRIFLELGRRLCAEGCLDAPRDVFYLEVEEILGFAAGTATTQDLKGLAALRKREFDQYRETTAPPDRFETRGAVPVGNPREAPAAPEPIAGDRMVGTGCCPGLAQGPVRVIRDPRSAQLEAGEILVAERTDPGWILLFPAAAGILVERGSLLSHSAIVARELGIPAIVTLPGITRWLATGDRVRMDGQAGVVVRLAEGAGG